ncbi:putative F-box protein [Cardamine amara subsp. amara]|uniref:F-box protein n=1 Tax=Cardamine amara subsp. amara TaxID=228776 RepID=A0ABD0ZHI3_CARAN
MERRKEHAKWIPFDLTREILLRLPAKSLMRFRCVSKLWASVTSDQDFINSFTTQSPIQRSCLILNLQKNDKKLFFSVSQHNNPEKYLLTLQKKKCYKSCFQIQSVHGLISFHYLHDIVIWNPTMRQYVTFPKPYKRKLTISYLGYDTIGNTYKLLSKSCSRTDEAYVLTLGTKESSWRKIKSIPTRYLPCKGICINGVLFYIVSDGFRIKIMSFDVRTEKFKLIQTHSCMHDDLTSKLSLVSYKGKLAWVILESCFYKLWVLEDAKNEEWSCKDFHLPFSPKDPIVKVNYFLSGVTNDGEFIYVSVSLQDKKIYVSYYDPKRNSNKRIKIERFEDEEFWLRNGCRDDGEFIGSLPNHIENLMSLKSIACSPSASFFRAF